MLKSLLVANRGEIACRIFRSARRLGVRTIAVFSDADAEARHVRAADEAYRIGPAAPRDSYLNIERILAAARATGAQAVHPGYGFLSENATFAQACVEAGLIFVGPPPAAIAAMGSKIVAKARMRAAGVPVLPGYEGTRQDLPHLQQQARDLGLPLIIKPAAGGGGKGMRIVRDASDIAEALAGARRLAESAFGSDALLLERYLPAPRHVEVQVFADTHGHFVHLGDRDCSVQRRHQKLIEEAPAPGIPAEVRTRMRAAAVLVAREIGYVSAGTVEFLFDGRDFYFMEMNTRLQVEHTVTETVTGLDLVEWQLRVAGGEPLPLEQEAIHLEGHAIEARVCAEDPDRDFLPSAGHLRLLEWPVEESVRVDAGFATGDVVPSTYDSLLGKVIARGSNRDEAAERLARALEHTYAAGVQTNERWLTRVLRDRRFLEVRHSIAFLQEAGPELAPPQTLDSAYLALAAWLLVANRMGDASHPWAATDGFTPNLAAWVASRLSWRGQELTVELRFERGLPREALINSMESLGIQAIQRSRGDAAGPVEAAVLAGDRWWRARCLLEAGRVNLWTAAGHFELALAAPRLREFSASAAQGGLTTPLPGVVATVVATVGQAVKAGEPLMVIEAMKMEHTISAPHDGVVKAIHFERGARVPEGSQLLELAPLPQSA